MATSNNSLVVQTDGGQITNANRQGRRSRVRQLKCGHSSCGKHGHSTDQCWVAHPDLRPHKGDKEGGRLVRGHTSGQHTAKASSSTPFRFLDLPAEIRYRIYEAVHGHGHALIFKKHGLYPTEWHEGWKDMSNLYFVSKKVYAETAFIRETTNAFNGHMRVEIRPFGVNLYANDGALVREVTKMTFFGYNSYNMFATTFDRREWNEIGWFPNVKEIHVEWSMLQYKYKTGSNNTYSKGWRHLWQPGTMKAFYAGEQDYDLSWYTPFERLKLNHLLWLLKVRRYHCKLFVTIMQPWLDNDRKPVFIKEIKYSIGRGGLKSVLYRRAYHAPPYCAPAYRDPRLPRLPSAWYYQEDGGEVAS
ncbi:hypothetical protein EDD36DRAFT_190991 [Exophiala viscosa]|uniref:Uncharacterized protein n=1 Tax=Exophiala viscosa TaxID=2486360 RepID=A0AAN6IFW5_9EURO|nr:hypothetical protein EDD36DRAFT_190991 [Exophiala viscosa]